MKPKKSESSEKVKEDGWSRHKDWYKEKIELVELEGQFGLILRERNDHKNYVMLNFNDLEVVVRYFEIFKRIVRE